MDVGDLALDAPSLQWFVDALPPKPRRSDCDNHGSLEKIELMPSVRESRAGDDFHYLWAARRCLALVDPTSDLRLVRVEGPSPTEAPDDDDLFLGVDVIEYFGGESADNASSVAVSQLKYSTLHPDRPWTVARLCELHRRSAGSSVIGRLADAWKGLVALHASDVSVGLVSNQPLSPRVADMLTSATAAAGVALTFARLVAAVPEHRNALADLKTRSRLGSADFVRFLCALDLSACGSEPRVFQRLQLVSGVGTIVLGSPSDLAGDLVELVRSTVLPEAKRSVGLRRSDVLAQLGASTHRDLFPAPPKFDPVPDDAVKTSDAPLLATTLLESHSPRVLAHGTYGVGKTTTIQQLEEYLSPGSVVISYDCFGQGDYRNPGSNRHVVRTALVQLANEVSVRCGLPPLIVSGAVIDSELWRRFEDVLDTAAATVQDGGLLVLAIDAADNSLFAGSIAGDRTFVPGIWRLRLPERARLLVTCRSQHRAEVGMGLPEVEVELHGFDQDASTAMLRRTAPHATAAEEAEFHRLTNGNPRLQTYAQQAAADASSVETVLGHAADGLDEIFRRIIEEAFERAELASDLLPDFAVMHAMSPPARVSVLSEVLGLTVAKARALCEHLSPGVLIDGDTYGFRDQNFDDYVRDRVGEERWSEANRRLAGFFRDRPSDSYAASALAGHLFNCGDWSAVIELALEREPTVSGDPLWEVDIVKRRLQLGALAAARSGRLAEFGRVLLAAAYAARSDTTLITALKDWPELAERFADPDLLTLVHDRAESDSWRGPTLMRTAAMLAWSEEHQPEARLRMNNASGWISRWSRLPDNERQKWHLTARDVAAGAEAAYALEGVELCRDLIWRWRPAEFRLGVTRELVRRLVRRVPPDKLRKAIELTRVGRFVQAEAIALYSDAGVAVTKAWVLSSGRSLARIPLDHPVVKERPGWGPSFCLAVASAGASQRLVDDLLNRLGAAMPRYAPHEYADLSNLVSPLLCVSLRHLGKRAHVDRHALVEGLLPLPEGEGHAAQSDRDRVLAGRREYATAIDALLPVIEARVGLIRGTCGADALSTAIVEPLAKFKADGKRWWFKGRRRFATWMSVVAAAAVAAGEAGLGALEDCLETIDDVAGASVAHLRLALGSQLLAGRVHVALGVQLVEDGASGTVAGSGTASERRDALFGAADVVLGADDVLAHMCFRQALEVSRDIDDDAIREIAASARLAASCTGVTAGDRRHMAMALTSAVERSVGRVSDDEQLPIRRVVDAEARLDPDVALRTVAKWHQAGLADIENTVAVVARAGVAAGHLDPRDALALVKLALDPDDQIETILEACDQLLSGSRPRSLEGESALRQLNEYVARDAPARARPRLARRSMEWFAEHGIDTGSHLEDIAALVRLHSSRTDERAGRAIDTDTEYLATDLLVDLFDDEAIAAMFADMRARYASADEIAATLDRSIGTALPRNRVKILQRLQTLMDDSRPSNVQALAGVIDRRAREWEGTPGVHEWLDESVKFAAEHYIKDLLVVEGDALDHWRTELRFPSTPTAIQAACDAVADNLGDFTDIQLVALAEYVASGLPESTRLELAGSILTDLGSHDPSEVPPTRSLGRGLVEFCWEMLGARDRRPRWRAAHVARELLVSSRQSDFAVEWAAVIADPPRADGDPPFLTMSALLWAWMATARAVDENPVALAHMRAQAALVAADRSFPHASIREFARRVALRLDAETDSQGALAEELELANRPRLCAIDRQSIYNREDAYEAARETVFDFDTMDTVRYWYQHLAELFVLPTAAIVQRADRWISEVWGRTNEECTLDYGRMAERSSWQLMSNDHGSNPTVENLQTYLEYHAMLVVAGELLDEGAPVVYSPYDDVGDPWEYWLRSRIDSSASWWLAQRRSAVPLDEASQGLCSASAVWDELSGAHDPVAALGLPDGWFWADGHADWSDSEWRVSAWASSAMVTRATGPALVRALLNSTPPSSSLPSVGSDEHWNVEIDAEGFVLRGWVSDRHDFLDGLDDGDPYWLRAAGQGSSLSADFQTAVGLVANKTDTIFSDDAGEAVVTQQIWSNSDGDEREISSGNRLIVRLADLKRYAGRHELDLIVGLMGDRYKRDRNYGGSDDDDEGNRVCKVWIIPSQE